MKTFPKDKPPAIPPQNENSINGNDVDEITKEFESLSPSKALKKEVLKQDWYLKPSHTKSSEFWQHYWVYDLSQMPKKKDLAVCKYCKAEVKAKNETGSLSSHLSSARHK